MNNLKYERHIWDNEKIDHIAGVDEVGRGPLAGPVVACAVIFPSSFYCSDITDSKKISASKREELYSVITENAICYSIAQVKAPTIDRINIAKATELAMIRAINSLDVRPQYLLTDHVRLPLPFPQINLKKGDLLSHTIGAASILAKVYRDRMMKEFSEKYPGYGFEKNMGYGTRQHIQALSDIGVCSIHRRSFSPVRKSLTRELFTAV
ncbi:MAG: ribonuclease HII [Candidatus Muiribacteriaceae bacterium]